MSIEHVARAMTGGRPRADFTARVMAPIWGRPRPDFTERVMARIAAEPPARPNRARLAWTAGIALVPAAIAAFAVLAPRSAPMAVPPSPDIAARPDDRALNDVLPLPNNQRAPRPSASAPRRAPRIQALDAPVETPLDAAPIYVIGALDGPQDIAMKSIEPAACTIPALAAPAPLTVPSLAGAPPAGSPVRRVQGEVMKRVSLMVIALVAGLASPSSAQQSQGVLTSAGSGQGQGQGQGGGQGRVARPMIVQPDLPTPSMTNVRLQLTITDQTGSGQPIKKVMTLVLAGMGNGRVRSSGQVYRQASADNPTSGFEAVTLNADANIDRIEGDKVRASITVEYAPAPATRAPVEAQGTVVDIFGHGSPLNQSVQVVLTDGKPLVIVQAADPITDRKVTLEALATILR